MWKEMVFSFSTAVVVATMSGCAVYTTAPAQGAYMAPVPGGGMAPVAQAPVTTAVYADPFAVLGGVALLSWAFGGWHGGGGHYHHRR